MEQIIVEEVTELYQQLAASGALEPLAIAFVAATVWGVIKTGIKFLLLAAVVLFVLTALGVVVL